MSLTLQRHHKSDHVSVAAAGPFVVTLWHDALTAEAASWLQQTYSKVNSGLDQFVSLIVLEPSARLVPDETKEMAAALMGDDQDRITGVGVVVESTGFRAAGLRSLVSTLGFLVRTPYPFRAFESISEAAAWAVGIQEGYSPVELAAAVESMRKR